MNKYCHDGNLARSCRWWVMIVLCWVPLLQANWQVQSSPEQVKLVELFTSQGCSSCPPADRWLSQLKSHKDLWQRVVPVAYHVTYWDYLGWQDPFAHPLNDKRHRDQAARVDAGVYTPGVFRNGREWRHWYRNGTDQPAETVGTLIATGSANRVDIQFTNATTRTLKNPKVEVAYLSSNNQTAVAAGENDGRRLRHDFVRLATTAAHKTQSATLMVGNPFSTSITINMPAAADAVAIWLTDGDTYVQATGTWIKPQDKPRADQ